MTHKLEKNLIQAISRALPLIYRKHGCMIWRNNTGSLTAGKRFIRFGLPGSPDFIGILSDGRFLGIEAKAAGKKQSPEQKQFQAECEKRGAVYILAYDVQDVINILTFCRTQV